MADWAALLTWSKEVAGIALSQRQREQLQVYVELLLRWNEKIALVSQRDSASILAKHVADSLFAAAQCGGPSRIADLGSGAGFPGLPIAIANPGAQVCLIESRGKKVSFLEEARRAVGAGNCTIYHGRIELAAAEHGPIYDVAVSRALADTDRLLALALPLLAPSGRLIAMQSASGLPGEPGQRLPYTLPDGSSRELLVVTPSVALT
ncbi:MAG: 16S rRNA (guanine(527)-N(7))-methyltransferase RsmG [Candidatus Binatia bacterium]